VEGTITAVDTAKNTLTITPAKGAAVVLTLTSTTQLLVNGQAPPANFDLTTLKGGRAFATYQTSGTTNNALRVNAHTPEPSP
jgi:hypothetical protein